jgi:hypothetical protein
MCHCILCCSSFIYADAFSGLIHPLSNIKHDEQQQQKTTKSIYLSTKVITTKKYSIEDANSDKRASNAFFILISILVCILIVVSSHKVGEK